MTSASIYAVSSILQAATMALFTLPVCVSMASTKSDEDVDDKDESEENHEGKHPEGNLFNFEPEVPEESMLVPTDNFDSFEQDPPPDPSTFEVESHLPKRQNDSENLPENALKDLDAVWFHLFLSLVAGEAILLHLWRYFVAARDTFDTNQWPLSEDSLHLAEDLWIVMLILFSS